MRSHTPQTLALLLASTTLVTADETTTLDPTATYGTWEGWGVSLAWWAAAFGTRDDLASLFFSLDDTTYNGASVPGLGLTIARYNAGACSWNSIDGESMVESPDIIASRQMEGYWLDWNSTDASSSSWDWTVDSNQRTMMQKAQSLGADTFELFSNSPMWWMCANHNPSGSDDGSSDNLQTWNHDQHAVYLATIAERAASDWGITFASVDAFNEPSSDWWSGTSGTQEGCHFSASTQASVLPYLRSELDARSLSATLVSASDETSYDLAITTWNTLVSAGVSATVDRINVHGYQGASGRRDTLYALAQSSAKALWNSEYGESDATGSSLASNLILDFRWLHPTAWVYWQAVDGGGWGLVDGDNDALTLGDVSRKYFVLAQFARHVRPGMTILDGGSDYTVAAYDASSQTLVIVAVNWGDAQYLNFELSGFSTPGEDGASVDRWSTMIGDDGDEYVSYSDTTISGTKFWSYFETNQIQTFEISGVVI
ncbi:glycoside hydrolase superfamily [Xylariaceae sp. FL0016]|nr:glycoside hydrolase superfamily [Xylariaceae sp. FL0016]